MKKRFLIFGGIILFLGILTVLIISLEKQKVPAELQSLIDGCKEYQGNLCLPEQTGSCTSHDKPDDCYYLFNKIQKEQIELCYDLNRELLVSYCLAKLDMENCTNYALSKPSAQKVCELIRCEKEYYNNYNTNNNFSILSNCWNMYNKQ